MTNVWIVQEPMEKDGAGAWRSKYDIGPAREFGRVRFLTSGGPDTLDVDGAVGRMAEALAEYADGDHVLLLGDPVLTSALTMVLVAAGFRRISFLKWDSRERRYWPTEVSVEALFRRPVRFERATAET